MPICRDWIKICELKNKILLSQYFYLFPIFFSNLNWTVTTTELAVSIIIFSMASTDKLGLACLIKATTPVTWGVAIEVPVKKLYKLPIIEGGTGA